MSLPAQSGTYAGSAEYQGMLEELHAPAPSPIFLATGVRPVAEQDLKVQVHNTRNSMELKTQSMQISIDRPTATLTMLNLQTKASWVLSLAKPNPPVCAHRASRRLLHSPISPGNKTRGPLALHAAGRRHHRHPRTHALRAWRASPSRALHPRQPRPP